MTVPTTIERIGRSFPNALLMSSWKQTMTNGFAAV